jgi:hypothetical protein
MKPGDRVKFKDEKIYAGLEKERTGKLLNEYEDFYLIKTTGGYRECVNKAMIIDGTARIEVLK